MTSTTETTTIAQSLLAEHWDLDGTLTRLCGENLNYLVVTGDGANFVLKITADRDVNVGLEEASIGCLDAAGHPVPGSIEASSGARAVAVNIEGERATARLQRFIPGTRWREAGQGPALLRAIGVMIARVHESLATFEHEDIHRSHPWDLAEAKRHRDSIGLIDDRAIRRTAEHCFHLHAACARPVLAACPSGALHGDLNDENILVEGDAVVGILDLGDCLHGALVQDLAIAIAYGLQHPDASLETMAELVAGYDAIRRLQDEEEAALFPLVMARLATSLCIASERRRSTPSHDTWYEHQETTVAAMQSLKDVPPRIARTRLMHACRTTEDTATATAELLEARAACIGPSLSISYEDPIHVTMGRDQYLHDADGRPFLDLVNNVAHVGHCNQRVVEAITSQARLLNTNTRYLHEGIVQYAERLTATMPDELDTCFLVNSGSEANELALRLARSATGANDVLVVDGAYHGNTDNCIAMSPYKFNGPAGGGAPNWVHVVPTPDTFRGEIRGEDDDAGHAYALELARVIGEACSRGRSIAGFFAEPILSCGGQIPLPAGYLAAAFEHVRKAGGVCIADEVQIGFGRVGEAFWGFELHDVVPDIVVMGKPIGNGHPMGAVVTTRSVAESFDDGMEFFSTFGGNPVSCACGIAVLDEVHERGLQERARALGERFMNGLLALKERHELIGDVRGRGLFLGIELVRDRVSLEPADTEASGIVNAMRRNGVLLSADGPLHNVIKIKPPMVLDENDIDMTVRLLDDVLSDIT